MVNSLVCLLSYGLMCSAAQLEVEPAKPVPIAEQVAEQVAGDSASDAVPASADSAAPAAASASKPAAAEASKAPLGAASQVLARVQAFYDSAADVSGSFQQTIINPVYGTKKVHKGQLRVKKPGLMVWDYAKAEDPDVWIEGKQLWVVEQPNKQVLKKQLTSSDFAGADKFLFGGRQLLEDFMVKLAGDELEKRYGKPGHTAIRLKPKQKNAHYQELMLVVDDETGRVDAFVVLNADKSTNHFELSGQKVNQGLSDAAMKFRKPAGYVVVEP